MPRNVEVDFGRIKPHGDSRDGGFEELCCQLAFLDQQPGVSFHRKGPGGDGGVECYIVDSAGSETGWQAKYFFDFQQAQVSQLDDSLDQALSKHPRLTRYIVCLPINLRDPRIEDRSSEQARWEAWVQRRVDRAAADGRNIVIELWDATALTERLGRDGPLYAGRLKFWFDETVLTPAWFSAKFEITRAALGRRYTPETNVKLPIRKTIAAFARDPYLYRDIERWTNKFEELAARAVSSSDVLGVFEGGNAAAEEMTASAGVLVGALRAFSTAPDRDVPVQEWRSQMERAQRAVQSCQTILWQNASERRDEHRSAASHYFSRLDDCLYELRAEFSDDRWRVVNDRRLLVEGDAGVGKSHLLADAADYHVARHYPAVMALGSSFVDGDPWRQLLDSLDLSGWTAADFLGALDAAAEATNVRALVIIDALNERHGISVWRERLAAFLAVAAPFPRVGIVLSCRTTYVRHVIGDSLDERALPRIEHVGFAGRAAEAARYYLDQRGIVRMAAPNFAPEFENPLFLRTCCDFLDRTGRTEFPRGLTGVSAVFGFYLDAVAGAISERMSLDRRYRIPERALDALADAIVGGERGYIGLADAVAVLDAVHPSGGRIEASLLTQFESEGVISIEVVREQDGRDSEQVRFTFERMSDHRIAARLLDRHLDPADPAATFAVGGPLYDFVAGTDAYERAGIIEAMAIQVPERADAELIDLVQYQGSDWDLWPAFQASLLWRDQAKFSDRTLAIVREMSEQLREDHYTPTLIAVATEPANRFNARFLHENLIAMTLPERDEKWSIAVASIADDDDSPVETLIAWTLGNGIAPMEEERAWLTALALTWLLSTSHRAVRDRATKALAMLLVSRRELAAKLIDTFASVDDPYVLDRLLAAAYGAAMQEETNEGLDSLARAAFDAVFNASAPTTNALIRDHARGLVELAHSRGMLPAGIDIARAQPPYLPAVPIETIPDATIETYKEDWGKGEFRDEIASSAIEDGDFARYEIDSAAGHWIRLPIEEAGRTAEEIYREWEGRFLAQSPGWSAALEVVTEAASRRADALSLRWGDWDLEHAQIPAATPDVDEAEADLRAADDRLKELLGPERAAEYEARAAGYISGPMFGANDYVYRPAHDGVSSRRWVGWRAHELGWTADRFGEFDRSVRGDRHDHRVERIGKKYQWIALHELAGRLADSAPFKRDRIPGGLGTYEGPWELGLRDMDPSILLSRTGHDSEELDSNDPTWWAPADVSWHPVEPVARQEWVQDEARDLFNDASLIEVEDPASNRNWLVLSAHVARRQRAMRGGERKTERESWYAVHCMVCRRPDALALYDSLTEAEGRRAEPQKLEMPWGAYVGEYLWHPAFADLPDWYEASEWGQPVETQPTVVDHYIERAGHDYSVDHSFNLVLPAPCLMRGLGLRMASGLELAYADASGKRLFFDPSIATSGPSAGLVDREAFLAMLDRENLEAIWVIRGEKTAYGGQGHRNTFGGTVEHTGVYRITPDGLSGSVRRRSRAPTAEQLAEYLGAEPADEATLVDVE